jgi:antitoxin VapB
LAKRLLFISQKMYHLIYIDNQEYLMSVQTAKVFMNGRSQALRLPKEFRFETDEVYITKQGDNLIVSPKKPTWDNFFDTTSAFDDDFLKDREDELPQERDF